MSDVLRVSILGTLPGGEVWSVNPVYQLIDSESPVTYDELNTVATAINALTVPVGVLAMMNTQTRVTGVKLEARDYVGTLEAQIEQNRPSPATGGGLSPHPFQTSIVTSLRTATPGGRGRGRLYWPATGAAISGTTLRLAAADVTAFQAGVKTYLSGIGGAITPTLGTNHLVVWSRAYPGSHQVIKTLMGDVLDVQRRRRDQQVETYQSLDFP